MHNNWLESENPYKLAKPPAWWLTKLNDQDSGLVVFPSRVRMAYVLCRRRVASNAIAELVKLDESTLRQTAGRDGQLMADHNLIYVRHLIGETVRRFEIFQWLTDHDIQAAGGGEKYADKIEDVEADIAAQKRKTMLDNIDHRARDAWRSLNARTGRRVGAGAKQGYRRATLAKQMPVPGFTPRESAAAIFARD